MSVTRKDSANKYKYQFIEEDGITYVSKMKVDKFAWVRFPSDRLVNLFKIDKFVYGDKYESKMRYDHTEFLHKFKKLKRILKSKGMYAVYIENQGQYSLNGVHHTDKAFNEVKKYLREVEGVKSNRVSFIWFSDVELKWACDSNGELNAAHQISDKDKDEFYAILRSVFTKVTLPKDNGIRITFKLPRKKN